MVALCSTCQREVMQTCWVELLTCELVPLAVVWYELPELPEPELEL